MLHPGLPQILMRLEHQASQLEELLQYIDQAQAVGHPVAAAASVSTGSGVDAAEQLPLPLQRLARQLLPAPTTKVTPGQARAAATRQQRSSALIASAFNVVRQPAGGGDMHTAPSPQPGLRPGAAPAQGHGPAAGQGQGQSPAHDPATCANPQCPLCAYQRGLQHAAVAQQLSQLVGDEELEALATALAMEQQLLRQPQGRR